MKKYIFLLNIFIYNFSSERNVFYIKSTDYKIKKILKIIDKKIKIPKKKFEVVFIENQYYIFLEEIYQIILLQEKKEIFLERLYYFLNNKNYLKNNFLNNINLVFDYNSHCKYLFLIILNIYLHLIRYVIINSCNKIYFIFIFFFFFIQMRFILIKLNFLDILLAKIIFTLHICICIFILSIFFKKNLIEFITLLFLKINIYFLYFFIKIYFPIIYFYEKIKFKNKYILI